MVSFSKHHHFSGEYFLQNWSISDSIICSITKNPSNTKAWQKLIKTCKYFFAKNPILVINKLSLFYNQKWNILLKKNENKTSSLYKFQVPAVLCKFWLTDGLYMGCCGKPSIPFSTIFSYLHQVDIKRLDIRNHSVSFHEFVFLTSNVENIYLWPVTVKNEDGTIVPLEKLVQVLPKIKKIHISDTYYLSSFTTNTAKELFEIPHLRTIDTFELSNVTESLDIETFFTYLKFQKNKHTKFYFRFHVIISEGYKNRVKKIVDEIIGAPRLDYKIPHLYFNGIDRSKYSKICSLSRQL